MHLPKMLFCLKSTSQNPAVFAIHLPKILLCLQCTCPNPALFAMQLPKTLLCLPYTCPKCCSVCSKSLPKSLVSLSGWCSSPHPARAESLAEPCSVMTQMEESHHINSTGEFLWFWRLPSPDELDPTPVSDEIIPGLSVLQPQTSDLSQSRQLRNQQSK